MLYSNCYRNPGTKQLYGSPLSRWIAAVLISVCLASCTSTRQTLPSRTATEELLVSGAADRAAGQLQLDLPAQSRILLKASGFDKDSDYRYTLGAIKEALLKQDYHLVTEASEADVVVEVRSGALSIDENETLLGIPSFQVPLPLTGTPEIPEVALFKRDQQQGIAKLAVTAYNADDGSFIASTSPEFGFSHETRWTVLIFLNWTTSDLIPENKRDDDDLELLPAI